MEIATDQWLDANAATGAPYLNSRASRWIDVRPC